MLVYQRVHWLLLGKKMFFKHVQLLFGSKMNWTYRHGAYPKSLQDPIYDSGTLSWTISEWQGLSGGEWRERSGAMVYPCSLLNGEAVGATNWVSQPHDMRRKLSLGNQTWLAGKSWAKNVPFEHGPPQMFASSMKNYWIDFFWWLLPVIACSRGVLPAETAI